MSWKQSLLFVSFIVYISTLFLSRRIDNSSTFKVPKPYRQNSLGQPIIEENGSSTISLLTDEEIEEFSDEELKQNNSDLKYILYFTSYFHMPDFQFGFGQEPFEKYGCQVTNCYTTNNKSYLGTLSAFDAMLFHMRDMNDGRIALPNKKRRKPNQRYVMFLMESPKNDGFPYQKFADYFNWTMTFRRDSDFHRPYGWVQPKDYQGLYAPSGDIKTDWSTFKLPSDHTFQTVVDTSKRLKKASWLVSNCKTHSQREQYVQELSKYIEVDIYGGCGNKACPEDPNQDCHTYLASNYLFYLSFENSLCKDYVTEKFWSPLSQTIVPVVLGGANYTQIAPPNSFIDALNFANPKHLAKRLNYLMSNSTAYNDYFQWKKYFDVKGAFEPDFAKAMCQLCQALNDDARVEKHYEDMNKWWRNEANCKSKGDYPWSKPEAWSAYSSLSNTVWQGAEILVNSLRDSKVIV